MDIENAPVILGSFEVTKTDADLTQKKSIATSTIRPFSVTNSGMKIKTKKITIEKVKLPPKIMENVTVVNRAKIESVTEESRFKSKLQTTATVKTPRPTTSSTTTSTTSTTTLTATPEPTDTPVQSTIIEPIIQDQPSQRPVANVQNPPRLDEHLFTHAPVLDREPWLPINPTISVPTTPRANKTKDLSATIATSKLDKKTSGYQILSRNKYSDIEAFTDTPNKALVYHSYSNPAFTFAPQGIERLGTSDVRPYPIPVNKINEEDYITAHVSAGITPPNYDDTIQMNNGNYEHLGGGIIVKKSETASTSAASTTVTLTNDNYTTEQPTEEASIKFGDLLLELLENDEIHNKSVPTKPTDMNFANIKDYVTKLKNKTDEPDVLLLSSTQRSFDNVRTVSPSTTYSPLSTASSEYVEVETVQYTPEWDQKHALFPAASKQPAINNGTTINSSDGHQMIRRIFNHTLKAWIVENSQKRQEHTNGNYITKRNSTDNIQNISAIFDTLASKLGMTPNIATKLPPFIGQVQNKVKKNKTDALEITGSRPNDKMLGSIEQNVPILLPQTSTEYYLPSSAAAETVLGEAEIEEVDPTQYEEMLLLDGARLKVTTVAAPALITLMPVKSNSGLRLAANKELDNGRSFVVSRLDEPSNAAIIRTQIMVTE